MPLTLKKGSTPNFTLDAEKNYFNELQGGNIKTDDIVADTYQIMVTLL